MATFVTSHSHIIYSRLKSNIFLAGHKTDEKESKICLFFRANYSWKSIEIQYLVISKDISYQFLCVVLRTNVIISDV
jgi:hypothetical protein